MLTGKGLLNPETWSILASGRQQTFSPPYNGNTIHKQVKLLTNFPEVNANVSDPTTTEETGTELPYNASNIAKPKKETPSQTQQAGEVKAELCDQLNLDGKLTGSKPQAKKAILSGQISVNLECIKNTAFKVNLSDQVFYLSEQISTLGHRYLMQNKPLGYICSTQDEAHPSVLNLIDIVKRERLHIVRRLDVDTTGLVLITDDDQWSHRLKETVRNLIRLIWLKILVQILLSSLKKNRQ